MKFKRFKQFLITLAFALLAAGLITGCSEGTGYHGSMAAAEYEAEAVESRLEAELEAAESQLEAETEAAESRLEAEIEAELQEKQGTEIETGDTLSVEEDGSYTDKNHVALYIHTYGCLPDNYLTKREAEDLGWNSKEGNLWEVAPGASIGGSHFGNYEGQLPEKKGRKYFECDIDYEGGYRGAERIIYSNDGLVFYTGDHYETFEQLY